MEITYLGHSSFKIKGKNGVVVTDPFSPSVTGLKFPKVEADIVTVSHQHEDHNFIAGVAKEPFVISIAGEYEVKGISVFGLTSFHDDKEGKERKGNTIYVIEVDGIRVCHLGDLGHLLSAKSIEELNGVEILMIPVGGTYTIGPKEASEVIKQIDPLIVIPMHYKTKNLTGQDFDKLAEVSEFLTQMGVVNPEKTDKLSITRDKLPQEMKIILLDKKE